MEQHTAKPPSSTLFKQTRNYQVSQQGVILALVNRHFGVTLSAPKKKSVVAQQMIIINYLKRESDVVPVEDFIHRRLGDSNTPWRKQPHCRNEPSFNRHFEGVWIFFQHKNHRRKERNVEDRDGLFCVV